MTETTYYNLNLPDHGDQNWDIPVNANFESIDALIHTNAEAIAGKQATITGGATTITSSNLTASKALVSDANGKVAVSNVTSTELGYVSGVTSAIQTQIGNKQETLVSGTNIKTINSESLLGSGNIAVQSVIDSNNKLNYAYLSNTPTIPTVNNATLTITQNGTSIGTFTANASSDVSIALTDTTYNAFTGADGVNAGSSGLVPAPTATDDTKYLKGDGTWDSVDALPAGVILPYGGTTAPSGFLICDGSAISRTTYADLFAIIGTAYGTGDGSTTFNLPNFTNRWLGGNGQGYLNAGLPDISGTFGAWETNSSHLVADNGPFKTVGNTGGGEQNGNGRWITTEMKLSYANSIYGSSTTVQPATCKTYFIIKY